MKENQIKITKKSVDDLPLLLQGLISSSGAKINQVEYYDTDLKPFGIRVSPKKKTYIVRRKIEGKMRRVVIGDHGVPWTPETARKKALEILGQLVTGVDINKEKAKTRIVTKIEGTTLQQVYNKYVEIRTPRLSTRRVDESLLKNLSDWLESPYLAITEDMVDKRHTELTESAGKTTATNTMRFFRRIWNCFNTTLPKEQRKTCPTERLTDGRRWHKPRRRKTSIRPGHLAIWYQAVMTAAEIMNKGEGSQSLLNFASIVQDYLLLTVLTGLRKGEGLSIEWSRVNMPDRSFHVPGDIAKNEEDLYLPMSDMIYAIFKRRQAAKINNFVFPGDGASGHLTEPKRHIAAIETVTGMILNGIETEAEYEKMLKTDAGSLLPEIGFCLNDLRRTFASVGQRLVSYTDIKRMMNHQRESGSEQDVTQGYIVTYIEDLREPQQRVTDKFKELMKVT